MGEPVTALTDYALAAASLAYAVALRGPAGREMRLLTWCWRAAFVLAAVSAAAGGTFHALAARGDAGMLRPALWNVATFSMGACAALIAAGVRAGTISGDRRAARWLAAGVVVTLLGVAIQQTGWRHGAPVNHNDVYHLVQIAGLYGFFRFALMVREPARHVTV